MLVLRAPAELVRKHHAERDGERDEQHLQVS